MDEVPVHSSEQVLDGVEINLVYEALYILAHSIFVMCEV